MAHAQSMQTLVLRVHDVGEADRFCILFTRERGRVAARASGVRKMKSRMGGTLLPLRHVTVQLKESSGGYVIAGAMLREGEEIDSTDIETFTQAAEGLELLLAFLQDEEPQPELFDATLTFLQACGKGPQTVLAFKIYLLHTLGFLPGPEEMEGFATLTPEEHAFVDAAASAAFLRLPELTSYTQLRSMTGRIFAEQIGQTLRAPGIAAAMR
jgi:DNA repair protein RecO (recombination protein O)